MGATVASFKSIGLSQREILPAEKYQAAHLLLSDESNNEFTEVTTKSMNGVIRDDSQERFQD